MEQIKKLAKQLEFLGLTGKETRVYVASLFLGSSPVQKIAEQAEIKRATTYVILDQLERMGLVSESTEGTKTVFIAESPSSLMRWLEKQENSIKDKKEELKNILPELEENKRAHVQDAPKVRFYKGIEGVVAMHIDSIRKSKPNSVIYGFTNITEINKMLPEHTKESPKDRLKKKISSKLFYWSEDTEMLSNSKSLRETKRLKEPPKADISLFEDRATILTYGGENSMGVVIESKQIVGALRQLFELAWKESGS